MFGRKITGVSVNVSTELCTGCGLCVERCRRKAMGLVKLRDETYAMLVNPENCTGCGKCERSCKSNAIEIRTETSGYEEAVWEF
ncbi:4Fe-4S dicluster domain-containing protein [Paludibacter sp. 221]|uniref:ATP-binding protein n=1 Tax=Paludibacter sp. 221 TaxID=2302939 RepID=UPI0013D2E7DC|nr:4Fe-4S dicluster domain-containing protein [Paludibacter sp. 221]NDV47285.1 4Fe-4S dicluster domain-containing protein [Paludibacter sp. 221]